MLAHLHGNIFYGGDINACFGELAEAHLKLKDAVAVLGSERISQQMAKIDGAWDRLADAQAEFHKKNNSLALSEVTFFREVIERIRTLHQQQDFDFAGYIDPGLLDLADMIAKSRTGIGELTCR